MSLRPLWDLLCLTDSTLQYIPMQSGFLLAREHCGMDNLSVVSTPLQLPVWEESLCNHPHKEIASYVLQCIREGFRIGLNRRSPLKSAVEHLEVIKKYLERVLAGWHATSIFYLQILNFPHFNLTTFTNLG